jgi:hypothetical protein
VDGIEVLLEFFCPVGDGQPGTMLRNPGAEVGSKISAIRMSGAELVALDSFTVRLSGETLDHGGIQEGIEVHVANLLPFVVLKTFALEERAKDKDSYDIVWTLNGKRPSNTPVSGIVFVMNSGHERGRWSVGWSS